MEIAGFPVAETAFAHAGVELSLYGVADLERFVDRDRLLRDEAPPEPPYWAHLWIGARALARFIAEGDDLSGLRVLDLGCGLGLPGLVAAARGAEVWFADREAAPLDFVRASAKRNRLERRIRLRLLDFTRESLDADFDVILGAEVVYDPASYLPLADFIDRHLRPDGLVHVTDAFRADAERFFGDLERRGFAGARRPWREWEDGRPHGLFLWTFRRSG
ncbi:MAG: class I SAM-dependent methyltransferase [Candidatus Binatia bacterium]